MYIPYSYFTLSDVSYYGYKFFFIENIRGPRVNAGYIVDFSMKEKLRKDTYSDNSIVVPDNASIYLFPNCPCAVADVKKNYTVKRGLDSGDYNVYCSLNKYSRYFVAYTMLIFPSKRIVIGSMENKTLQGIKDYATKLVLPTLQLEQDDFDTAIYYTGQKYFYFLSDPTNVYRQVLEGNYTKPLVPFSALNLSSNMELTLDVLQLVYQTGSAYYRDENAISNFEMQLNVLNQYNWREYPGTIRLLQIMILSTRAFCALNAMSDTKSKFSKTVQQFLTKDAISIQPFKSNKDAQLGQTFVKHMLNLQEDVKFAKLSDLLSKTKEFGISPKMFEMMFNPIVRITAKDFSDED